MRGKTRGPPNTQFQKPIDTSVQDNHLEPRIDTKSSLEEHFPTIFLSAFSFSSLKKKVSSPQYKNDYNSDIVYIHCLWISLAPSWHLQHHCFIYFGPFLFHGVHKTMKYEQEIDGKTERLAS